MLAKVVALFHGIDRLVFRGVVYLWLGVPFFFVISGYCIAATCDAMRRRKHSVREYLWRRYRRIFPPFWIFIGTSALLIWFSAFSSRFVFFSDEVHPISQPASLSAWQWIGNLTLTESWRYLLAGGPQLYFMGHAWSLCYEEQFYLVCGLLLFLTPLKFFRSSLWVTIGVLVVAVPTLFLNLPVYGFFFDGRWLMFALGLLVYWLLNYASGTLVDRTRRVMIGIAMLLTAGLVVRPVRLFLTNGYAVEIFAALIFSVVLLYLRRFDTQIIRSRLLGPITWCGTMCYSLYLSHWPIVKALSNWLWHHGLNSARSTLFVTVPALPHQFDRRRPSVLSPGGTALSE